MAEALRAALRLLPADKSSARSSSASGINALLVAFPDQTKDQSVRQAIQRCTGLACLAKGVLTYVGFSLSVVTANQLTGPSTLLAKEAKSESFIMAEKKSGSSLHGVASNRCLTDRESERDTVGLYRHYEMLSAGKGTDKVDGLSFLPGEQWGGVSNKTDLPWQCGPDSPLDYGSQYVTVSKSPVSEFQDFLRVGKKDCGRSAEIELEWQWIVDQQQAPKCESFPLTESKDSNEENSDDSLDKDAKEGAVRAERESCTTSSLLGGSKTERSSDAGTSKSSRVSGNLSVELNAEKSSHKDGALWRTADSKELAALVSQKGHGYLENCDLPPSQSSLTWKGPLSSCDFNPSRSVKSGTSPSVDKLLLASLLSGHEPTQLENKSLTSFPLTMGMSDPTPFGEHLPNISQPLAIPSVLPRPSTRNSSDDWNTSQKASNRKHVGVTKRGYETLGEALCHSQTRARQAEKLAAKALQEREKLAQLLFREAWTARTYKQWVQTLELENILLKTCSGSDLEIWMDNKILNPSSASEQIANNPWKHVRKRPTRKKMHQRFPPVWWQGKDCDHGWTPESNVLVRCTIGVAFALGLSFAGAGLVIGWSMGWIFLSY